MGNCTQPTQNSDTENATIPMGSMLKNSILRRSQAAQNQLSSDMYVNVFIYSKLEGLIDTARASQFGQGRMEASASTFSMQTTNGGSSMAATEASNHLETSGRTDQGSKGSPIMINYSFKYGSQEYTWVEHNCDPLHKGRMLSLDYRLGQVE